ncbi:MAG: hypothetical protein ACM3KR_09650 [Deltaproteobacteria bacterium]
MDVKAKIFTEIADRNVIGIARWLDKGKEITGIQKFTQEPGMVDAEERTALVEGEDQPREMKGRVYQIKNREERSENNVELTNSLKNMQQGRENQESLQNNVGKMPVFSMTTEQAAPTAERRGPLSAQQLKVQREQRGIGEKDKSGLDR